MEQTLGLFPTEQIPQVKLKVVPMETPKQRTVYTWICQYCGQPFDTTVYSQRYCSPTHKQYAYRERKRARRYTFTVGKNTD